MKVKFNRDWKFAEDGMHVKVFTKDQEEDVSEACVFAALRDGAAQPIGEESEKKENSSPADTGESQESGEDAPRSASPRGLASGKKTSKESKKKPK